VTVSLSRDGAAGPNGAGGRTRDVASGERTRAGTSLTGASERVADAAPRSAEDARGFAPVLGGCSAASARSAGRVAQKRRDMAPSLTTAGRRRQPARRGSTSRAGLTSRPGLNALPHAPGFLGEAGPTARANPDRATCCCSRGRSPSCDRQRTSRRVCGLARWRRRPPIRHATRPGDRP